MDVIKQISIKDYPVNAKERIYDAEIVPLLDQIEKICKKNDLAFLASTDLTDIVSVTNDTVVCHGKMAGAHYLHKDGESPFHAITMILKNDRGLEALTKLAIGSKQLANADDAITAVLEHIMSMPKPSRGDLN